MRLGFARRCPGLSRGCWFTCVPVPALRASPGWDGLYARRPRYIGSSVPKRCGFRCLTATTPGSLALPLVERPRHVVLVVFGGVARIDPDELTPPGVVGGRVPGALEELVRAQVRAGRVVRPVVAAALDAACA